MKEILGYFVSYNGAIWTVFNDNSTNYHRDIRVVDELHTVEVLERDNGDSGYLIVETYVLWESLLELSSKIESEESTGNLEELRNDLVHQLNIPEELDWSYFLKTAGRALVESERTGRNMKEFL